MPQEVIGGIWERAERLLNDQTAVTFALGTNSKATMVMSQSNNLPQYVTTHEPFDGQFICNCHNGKFYEICSHSIVAAEVNRLLAEFLDWHSSKFSGVNVSRLLGEDQPKGAARKGRVAKRKRPVRRSRTGTKQCIGRPTATSSATATDISTQSK